MINQRTQKEDKYYFYPTPSDTDIPFYIELAGITYPNINYHIDRRTNRLNAYVLEFVRSGRGYIECGSETYTVGAGDFYLLNKNSPHRYYADKEDPYTKIWINAGGRLISALMAVYGITESTIVRHIDVGDLFDDIAFLLRKITSTNKSETYIAVASKICEILIRVFTKTETSQEKYSNTTAGRIRTYIDNGIHMNITLSDIEKHFFLDKSYIIQLFRREFGITPKQYILKKKCDAAKSLLSDPTISIKEITEMLNFSSTQHFSSVFKHRCGISPNEFRKNEKNI